MFLGEYQHSLDDKGRVILPAKFRDQLGAGAVIAKGRGACLAVYPPGEFEKVARKTRELAGQSQEGRKMARSLFAGATDVVPDKQGRVAVPPGLRAYAHLEKDVVVTGAFTHVEIWDADEWQRQSGEGDDELIAGGIPEIGM